MHHRRRVTASLGLAVAAAMILPVALAAPGDAAPRPRASVEVADTATLGAGGQTVTIEASVGPLSVQSTGPITGTGTLELPFLTNEDAAEIAGTEDSNKVWQVIYKYPQDAGRVFQLSMNASNPKAPANCKDNFGRYGSTG